MRYQSGNNLGRNNLGVAEVTKNIINKTELKLTPLLFPSLLKKKIEIL